MPYPSAKEVIASISDMRDAAAGVRAEIAVRMCLALAYANGRQWNRTSDIDWDTGDIDQYPMEEDWDPKSREIRVVDNRTAPLLRHTSASTNATRIEAAVRPPKHLRSTEAQNRARVVQNVLNGMDEGGGFTRAAKQASAFRWATGNALIVPLLSANGQWVRWTVRPLTDLIWDVSNTSADLADHSKFALEMVFTLGQFEQMYGKLERYGFDREKLPTIGELAPHYVSASHIGGSSLFAHYGYRSKEKGVRVYMLVESDQDDPSRWPTMYTVIDVTSGQTTFGRIDGNVINAKDPDTKYGHHGRPIFKLDAFHTNESVWSWGVPHAVMAHQDMLNIARSLQFQEISSRIYGYWLIDRNAGQNRESFVSHLTETVGGVLEWDSKSGTASPPAWITPNTPMVGEYIPLMGELSMAMDSQVHISQMNKGIGKTHIPENVQHLLLRESAVVVDNIVQDDKAVYADALKLTAGTIRLACERPNKMLARLNAEIGFTASDLETLLEIDPRNLQLDVSVPEQSIVSRSVNERVSQLNAAAEMGVVSREEYLLSMARDLERPVTNAQEREIHWLHDLIVDIANGEQYEGIPSINFPLFQLVAQQYIYGLDRKAEDTPRRTARVEAAVETQRQIALERMAPMSEQPEGASEPTADETGSLPPPSGAPESINPTSAPTGATGGLSLGLPAAVA